MPVYTDAKGNCIQVGDQPRDAATTPPKSMMSTVTRLPPHKAAAMITTKEVHFNDKSDSQQPIADHEANSVMILTVTPTTELPHSVSADNATQQHRDDVPPVTASSTSLPKASPDKALTIPLDKDPFSTILQTFSTMPATSEPASPRPTPRLSIDLSSIPPQQNTAASPFKRPAKRNSKSPSPVGNPKKALLAYNQYGEIVKMKDMLKPKDPAHLTIVDCLRLIEKVYGYDFRARMANIIELQMEERTYADQSEEKPTQPPIRSLSIWDYADFPMSPNVETPEHQTTIVYSGPPRVLEVGCGNGAWCFASKERHPEWIIEGVDDSDHWSDARPDLTFRDFTTPLSREAAAQPPDYFKGFQLSQDHPEFTVRNLNALLAHSEPIPHNLYGLIRGRDVFDRVLSYKEFLEDVRLILQPDGVVEFVELDPRPREDFESVEKQAPKENGHVSGPVTDWTDKIVDRFKDPECEELATSVPGWTERVKERLKANLRPKDGVPASQLKSWLEGAGFWDVKEIIFRLQIGGDYDGGKLMQQIIQRRIDFEEEIPLLAKQLPKIEKDAISSGFYYFNLHIVTGRKPKYPRPGDLLLDGTRQEMTNSKYDAMAKLNDAKSNQWKRFDLDGKLTSMMKTLGAIHGSETTTPTVGSPKKEKGVAKRASWVSSDTQSSR